MSDESVPAALSQIARSPPALLRSGKPTVYSFVRFTNKSWRKVDVVWLNYEGAQMHYVTLDPEQFFDVNTFVGHPWIFQDSETGDQLVVQHRKTYDPIGWVPSDGWPPKRKQVYITLPVYSLKERCLQATRRLVTRKNIPTLDLPKSIIRELLSKDNRVHFM